MSDGDRRPQRTLRVGVMVGSVLAAVIVLAVVLFLLAQNTAAPTSPQTNGSLAALIVLVPALA
jgi:Mg/Co/Ni transporter MgtE